MRSCLHRRAAAAAMAAVAAALVAACRPSGGAEAIGTLVERACSRVPVISGVPADGARCLTLTVPENRANPTRGIPLHIVVLPALRPDAAPDPIFFLAGGPGQAATDLMTAPDFAINELRARRAIVFADQRGTGGSNGMWCRFYGPPSTPQSYFTEFVPADKVRECRASLEKRADLTQYTTAASVEDLEAIRAALDYPLINLAGGSYGTRLALEYMRRHGARVRSAILDGPVPPDAHVPENFGRYAAAALDALLDECAATAACAQAFPDLRAEAARVFARLRSGTVTARLAHPGGGDAADVTLTRDHVAEALRYMMYSSYGASYVPLALHRAAAGDYRAFAEYLIRWRAAGTFDALYLSITCAEDVPFTAPDAAERDEPTYLGGYRVRQQRAACAEWPRGTPPRDQFEAVASDVPVLIVSGMLDPVTRPANGEALLRTLPRGVHVRVPFGGHSPAGLAGLECLAAIKRTFVERGHGDGLDTSCVARIARPAFPAVR